MIMGPSSGKVIFVDSRDDVFIFPLKMLGYSLNSVEPSELEAARQILLEVAPHLYGLDSNTYGQTMADGTAAMTLGWTGPLGPGAEGHARTRATSCPPRARRSGSTPG